MNLLITGAWQQAAEYMDNLREHGHNVQFMQFEKDELPCEPSWVEGIIGNGIFLSHPIESFTHLRYIQLTSAGFDRVPMEYVKSHSITINNARGVYSIPMAEYAISGVLALYKKQRAFFGNQKEHRWEKARDLQELFGKRVCIFGCGSVGTECAKRFEIMGCMVFGIDPIVREHKNFFCIYHTDDAKEVLAKSDIVVITLPLTEQTRHMFDEKMLAAMRQGTVIVNIARGALIETDALIRALGKNIGGAVLDVFEEEPLSSDSPLWDMPNVIITPHNSFVGSGNNKRMSDVVMSNLKKVQ